MALGLLPGQLGGAELEQQPDLQDGGRTRGPLEREPHEFEPLLHARGAGQQASCSGGVSSTAAARWAESAAPPLPFGACTRTGSAAGGLPSLLQPPGGAVPGGPGSPLEGSQGVLPHQQEEAGALGVELPSAGGDRDGGGGGGGASGGGWRSWKARFVTAPARCAPGAGVWGVRGCWRCPGGLRRAGAGWGGLGRAGAGWGGLGRAGAGWGGLGRAGAG
jgi:hypothetical protein